MSSSAARAAPPRPLPTGPAGHGLREVVAASWRRSARSGVDPNRDVPHDGLTDSDLDDLRAQHPLNAVLPTVRDLLVDPEEGWVVALTDTTGRLLWVEGDAQVRRTAERVGFVPGARWSEDVAGTNAPGTALATGQPVQVLGREHFSRKVQQLNCVASPVRDRAGRVLGILDITGGPAVASPLARSLVHATTVAIEALLAPQEGERSTTAQGGWAGDLASGGPAPGVRLGVLGPNAGLLRTPRGVVPLGPRHAEILFLLAEHPQGLSAEELAVLLSEEELSDVTVRAEVSRLRRVVGPLVARSRPYRLGVEVGTDVAAVRSALAAGEVAQALASCTGEVLARSRAPGVVAVRERLHQELRSAVLAASDPGLLARWVASEAGAQDWSAWERLAQVAPPGSAQRLNAVARLQSLDRALR